MVIRTIDGLLGPGSLATGGGIGAPLDGLLMFFQWTGADEETNRRLIVATLTVVVLSLILWILNRTMPVWRNWIPGVSRRSRWDAVLRVRGLGAEERTLLRQIAEQASIDDVEEIVRSRVSFEHAVSHSLSWIEADPRRVQALDRVRRRLSWEAVPQAGISGSEDLLEHNLEIELFGTGDQAGYCARAVLVHRDNDALVLRLEKGLTNVPWGPTTVVRAYFWRENDAGYLFDATVIELRTLGDRFLFVAPPTHLERHQRRLHVRVPLRSPVSFLRVANGAAGSWLRGDPGADPGPLRSGVIEDLSAGGFRIRCKTPLEIADFLSFDAFPVVEGDDVLARIISERREPEQEGYQYGAQFLGLSATMRDAIAQHVFRMQRQLATEPEFDGADPAAAPKG